MINQTNDRALPILESLTNQNFGVDPTKWTDWWADQLGFVVDSRYSDDKPTITELYAPELLIPHSACFAAGTLVQTVTGPRKIEAIVLGDRVLSQHTSTGDLSFQPVLATHVNGPADTLRITMVTVRPSSPPEFTASGKSASGWTMARDLKAGDRLRIVGGAAQIDKVEPGRTTEGLQSHDRQKPQFHGGKSRPAGARFRFCSTGFRTVRPPGQAGDISTQVSSPQSCRHSGGAGVRVTIQTAVGGNHGPRNPALLCHARRRRQARRANRGRSRSPTIPPPPKQAKTPRLRFSSPCGARPTASRPSEPSI